MKRLEIGIAITILFFSAGTVKIDGASAAEKKLVVGTKIAAPFSMKKPDGSWEGISVDLWREIAKTLRLEFEFRETDLKGLIAGLKDNSMDVAVAAITVTADREEVFDFSHPFYTTGFAIAVPRKSNGGWVSVMQAVFSLKFLGILASLSALLLMVGLAVWFFERRRNPQEFGGKSFNGIASAFWWAAVTMTTVGYGDKSPKSFGGRLLAILWMFAAIILISFFTASITSTLTVSQLESSIAGPEDFPKVLVGTLPGSTSEDYLKNHMISHVSYDSLPLALRAVSAGDIDAVVYDAPLLKFLVNSKFQKELEVLPPTFERQDYAFGFSAGSPFREEVNRILLKKIALPEWKKILFKYLGG